MNEFGLLPFAPVLESLRIVMNVLLVGALLVILSEVIILLANLISLHPPRSARRRQS